MSEETTKAAPERDLTPEELIVAMEASFKDFKDGDIVDGEVVALDAATVTALDAFENTATGYTGTVTLTSSDSQAVLAGRGGGVDGGRAGDGKCCGRGAEGDAVHAEAAQEGFVTSLLG